LLGEVLTVNLRDVQADEEVDAAVITSSGGSVQQGVPNVARKRGSMSQLSGGAGLAYAEGPRGAAAKGEQHPLFRKQANEVAKRQKEARREAGE
jgi:hypothetical protein